MSLGILCAIPEEIRHFGGAFAPSEVREIAGFRFQSGRLGGHPAVLVETGIGKVSAGVVATLMIREFGCRSLIFSGVAGGLDPALKVGDVVVADRLVQHDYGALIDGRIKPYQPGVPPLPGMEGPVGYDLEPARKARLQAAFAKVDLPPLSNGLPGAGRVPALCFGTVVTGDSFLNCAKTRDRLHAEFGALAVEMEGAALAQVADRFGLPLLVIRALSDLAGDDSHLDFSAFVEDAGQVAARLVLAALDVMAEEGDSDAA